MYELDKKDFEHDGFKCLKQVQNCLLQANFCLAEVYMQLHEVLAFTWDKQMYYWYNVILGSGIHFRLGQV